MTPNPKIQELIKSMGIIPEDEHYDVAEAAIRKCADFLDAFNHENMVEEGMDGAHILEHFGVEE